MPLIKSSSKKAFSANVSAEMHGDKPKPQKQAVAIAFSVQRDAARKGMAAGGAVHTQERPMPNTSTTANSGHLKGAGSARPTHKDVDTHGPVPMRHRNRLGEDVINNPQGVGMPSTESKMGNGNRKSW